MSAVKNMKVLQDKVQEWSQEGYVEHLSEPAWCCNPMSVAVKFDPVKEETKLRPCIDLSRHVNKCTRVSHAKLDDLSVAQELISKDDYMASFDLAISFSTYVYMKLTRSFLGLRYQVKMEDQNIPVRSDGLRLQPSSRSSDQTFETCESLPAHLF